MKIIFEFAGGPLDGKAVVGRQGEQDEADRYYALTHHGKVGQRFRIASDYAVEVLAREQLKVETPHHFQAHYYRVTGRLEDADEVLVRAEYVEPPADERVRALASAGESGESRTASDLSEAFERRAAARLQEILSRAARSWTASYSHCWPVESPADDGAARLLALHLGHALLSDSFSVFQQVRQAGYPRQTLDLLGIAPGQDWFVACRLLPLDRANWLEEIGRALGQLAEFWLSGSLTIPACRDHINRVARHTQRGYGLVAGLHWEGSSGASQRFVADWRQAAQTGAPPAALVAAAEWAVAGSVVWMMPSLLGQFPDLGSCHLVALYRPL
ncbi:MAG: hypothetical protein J5I93_03065 [Pirellulaceae bacterium]|nr:hypothetical protein [Pirellulaceae bacterium]